jgi:O-antigen/teichoic acid export membrane protein
VTAGARHGGERTLSHQFLSATAWNTLLLPARFVVGIFATVIYYQVLGRDEVGLVFFLTSLATTVGVYADMGIERSLPRFLPEIEGSHGRQGVVELLVKVVCAKLLILAALIGCLFAFAAPLERHLVGRQVREAARIEAQAARAATGPERANLEQRAKDAQGVGQLVGAHGLLLIAAVATLLVLGALFDVAMQFLAAYFKQKAWNLITLVTTLLQPALVTGLVFWGFGVGGVLAGLVVTPLVSLVLAAFQVARAAHGLAPAPKSQPVGRPVWRRLARFAAMNYLIQLTTWLYDLEIVVFFSMAFLDFADVAVLGFAYKFAKDALGNVWTPLTGVMTPLLVRIKARESPAAFQDAHASLTRLILLLLVPAALGLALLTPRLVAALYPKYTAGVPLILVFILFTFGESMLSVPHNALMVYEDYQPIVASRLVPLVGLPLLFVVVPRFGAMGAALVVGLMRVTSRLVTFVAGARRLGVGFPFGFAARILAASGAFGVVLAVLLRGPGPVPVPTGSARVAALLPLVGAALLGAALYALALRATGGLHADERRRILALPLPLKDVLLRVL